MKTSPTPKSTPERVTGPSGAAFPIIAVLILTALTWGGIWELHQHWYSDPINPISPTQSAASPN